MARQKAHESLACDFISSKGCQIIDRNFAWKGGEIDIIALDQHELVFIEVKYRQDSDFGSPLERITAAQIRRIHQTALIYIDANPNLSHHYYRFDALAMTPESQITPQEKKSIPIFQTLGMDWIKNAF